MIYYKLLELRDPKHKELRNTAIDIRKTKENRKLKEKERSVEEMRKELDETKARIEKLTDKEYKEHNLRISSQVTCKSSVSLDQLRIEVDCVYMYAPEFHLLDNNLIQKIYRKVVRSKNVNDKICCEVAKAITNSRVGEATHLNKSRFSKPFTKAPFITKFKHEEYGMLKVQGNSRGNIESWYFVRELKDYSSRFIKRILDNVYNHDKILEEVNIVKQLKFYYSKARKKEVRKKRSQGRSNFICSV